MRPFPWIIFGVLFTFHALAQTTVPVFRTKQDSVKYANLQISLTGTRLLAVSAKEGSADYDSLMKKFEELMDENVRMLTTQGVKMRTIYRSDPAFTSYASMITSGKPLEVRRLSITGSGRTSLPDSLFMCTNLEELELVNWRLGKLPKKLGKLKRLREVTILNNQPTKPLKLARNSSIRDLTIRGDEGNNKLPRSYRKLPNVEVLDLSRNNMSAFPHVTGSKSLKKLALLHNEITLYDLRGRQPHSLNEINLSNNKVKIIPESIRAFKSVRKLNFNNNQIDSVSAGISELAKLEEISLYNNRLKKIPEAIYSLPALKVIDLYYNDISKADHRLGEMKNLEILYLANNKLYTLPDNLGQLPHLKELYLHHNRLSDLPKSVGELGELKVLRINDNQLLEFPESVLHLRHLQSLDISHNQIQFISLDKFDFQELKILALVGNPWDESTREALPGFAARLRRNNIVVHLNTFEDTVETSKN
jgi:Leucine-rich repeat (LRR) protein